MIVRKATKKDLDELMKIYEFARNFMEKSGNPTQWGKNRPTREQIIDDIEKGFSYVVCDENEIYGVFALCTGDEPTYKIIENGNWLNDNPYITIHRIASAGKIKNIFGYALEISKQQSNDIRIDTHKNNLPMQKQIEKNDFIKCGTIYISDGTPRIAYHWSKEK